MNYSYFEPREDGDYEVVVSEDLAIRLAIGSAARYELSRMPNPYVSEAISHMDDDAYLADFISTHQATKTDKPIGEYKHVQG